MTYVPVNIKVLDSDPQETPITDVTVAIMTLDGKAVMTSTLTGSDGVASFLLNSSTSYQLRLYKAQVTFKQPVAILVLDPPAENDFVVQGSSFVPPISLDKRLCVGYGFFRDVTGAPAANLEIQFIAKFEPLWLDGAGLLSERRSVRTDSSGCVQVNLIRCAKYDVIIQGYEDNIREISVPDDVNVNIPDLIFPIVSLIIFSPPGPYTLVVGVDQVVVPTVYSSDENVVSPSDGTANVQWSTEDPTIAVVLPGGGNLTLRGISPGQTTLKAVRWDRSIVHIPDPGISGQPVLITVT